MTVEHHTCPPRDLMASNGAYEQVEPAPFPARTTVGNDPMSVLVGIDVVAVLPER